MTETDGDTDKKQKEKHKHQAGSGQDRMYLLNLVLDEDNIFDYWINLLFLSCSCNQCHIVDLSNRNLIHVVLSTHFAELLLP